MPPNPEGFGAEAALLAARRVPTASARGGEKDAYARIAATRPSTRGIVQIDSEKSASDRAPGLGDGFPAVDASASGVRSPRLNTSEEHRAAAATSGQASATPRMRGLPV